jgi:hypothetical protein
MPFIWTIPWVFVRMFLDNVWCWQVESDYNLITKIPHSLLLISNIVCAVIIIRILYSKLFVANMSLQKITQYRRLAKSIFILIPIFGLHFIIFAWLPYSNFIRLGPKIEIGTTYVETFFSAFQGLVVSLACCYMHRDARIECILWFYEVLKKTKCRWLVPCLTKQYINKLRYNQNGAMGNSTTSTNTNNNNSNNLARLSMRPSQAQALIKTTNQSVCFEKSSDDISILDDQLKSNSKATNRLSKMYNQLFNKNSKKKRKQSKPSLPDINNNYLNNVSSQQTDLRNKNESNKDDAEMALTEVSFKQCEKIPMIDDINELEDD